MRKFVAIIAIVSAFYLIDAPSAEAQNSKFARLSTRISFILRQAMNGLPGNPNWSIRNLIDEATGNIKGIEIKRPDGSLWAKLLLDTNDDGELFVIQIGLYRPDGRIRTNVWPNAQGDGVRFIQEETFEYFTNGNLKTRTFEETYEDGSFKSRKITSYLDENFYGTFEEDGVIVTGRVDERIIYVSDEDYYRKEVVEYFEGTDRAKIVHLYTFYASLNKGEILGQTLEYRSDGRIQQNTWPDAQRDGMRFSQVETFEYYDNGNLKTVVFEEILEDGSLKSRSTRHFIDENFYGSFEEGGVIVTGRLSRVIDTDGNYTVYRNYFEGKDIAEFQDDFDADGNLLRTRQYDMDGNLIKEEVPFDNPVSGSFDPADPQKFEILQQKERQRRARHFVSQDPQSSEAAFVSH